jgi:LuxR family maltose regulon positive regulatory protein
VLLQEAQSRGIAPGYVTKLLAVFGVEEQKSSGAEMISPSLPRTHLPPAVHGGAPLLAEPLSDRELELLRLVAEGHSNQEIAQELFLAIGTVKKHLNNVFGKLDVSSRTQAIARARELNLL